MKSKRGGQRDGAGRKPMRGIKKISRSVAMTEPAWLWVTTRAEEDETSANEAIESLIRRQRSFLEDDEQ